MATNMMKETMTSVRAKPLSAPLSAGSLPGAPCRPRRRSASVLRMAIRPCRWGSGKGAGRAPVGARGARPHRGGRSGDDGLAARAVEGRDLARRRGDGHGEVATGEGVDGGVAARQGERVANALGE